MTREETIELLNQYNLYSPTKQIEEAIDKAIEALQTLEAVERIKTEVLPQTDLVRCKDCRHAHECHKSVQYTRNEPRTVTIGYAPIEFCSHGERREE